MPEKTNQTKLNQTKRNKKIADDLHNPGHHELYQLLFFKYTDFSLKFKRQYVLHFAK